MRWIVGKIVDLVFLNMSFPMRYYGYVCSGVFDTETLMDTGDYEEVG